jgi:hypothetical protein
MSEFLTKGCSSRQASEKNFLSFPSTIFSTTFSGFPDSMAWVLKMSFSLVQDILRNTVPIYGNGAGGCNLHGDIFDKGRKVVCFAGEVCFTVCFDKNADFTSRMDVGLNLALTRFAAAPFLAVAMPFFLKKSTAFSMSPSHSVRASLQSMMPTPVFSLNSLMSVADIANLYLPHLFACVFFCCLSCFVCFRQNDHFRTTFVTFSNFRFFLSRGFLFFSQGILSF